METYSSKGLEAQIEHSASNRYINSLMTSRVELHADLPNSRHPSYQFLCFQTQCVVSLRKKWFRFARWGSLCIDSLLRFGGGGSVAGDASGELAQCPEIVWRLDIVYSVTYSELYCCMLLQEKSIPFQIWPVFWGFRRYRLLPGRERSGNPIHCTLLDVIAPFPTNGRLSWNRALLYTLEPCRAGPLRWVGPG